MSYISGNDSPPLPPPPTKKSFLYLSKSAQKIAFLIFLQMELSSPKLKNIYHIFFIFLEKKYIIFSLLCLNISLYIFHSNVLIKISLHTNSY